MTAVVDAPTPQASAPVKTGIRQLLQNNIREYGMLLALAVIMVFFQYLTEGTLMQPLNLTNLDPWAATATIDRSRAEIHASISRGW